jgi:hypothetical protein
MFSISFCSFSVLLSEGKLEREKIILKRFYENRNSLLLNMQNTHSNSLVRVCSFLEKNRFRCFVSKLCTALSFGIILQNFDDFFHFDNIIYIQLRW